MFHVKSEIKPQTYKSNLCTSNRITIGICPSLQTTKVIYTHRQSHHTYYCTLNLLRRYYH